MTWKANLNVKKSTRLTSAEFSTNKKNWNLKASIPHFCTAGLHEWNWEIYVLVVLFTSNYIYFHKCSYKLWMGSSNWETERESVEGWERFSAPCWAYTIDVRSVLYALLNLKIFWFLCFKKFLQHEQQTVLLQLVRSWFTTTILQSKQPFGFKSGDAQ
jgi:hypothetical protein